MVTVLDFDIIETHNPKTFGILDVSIYNILIPIENVEIEIYAPGYVYPAKPVFLSKSLNIFNSNNTGLTKATCEEDLVDLPDGIWKVRYSICPNDKLFIHKTWLRTNHIQTKFDQAVLKIDALDCDEKEKKNKKIIKLREIEFLIESAVATVNQCNFQRGIDLYQRAVKEINLLLNSCQ